MAESHMLFAVSGCDTGFGHQITLQLAAKGHRVLAGCLTPLGVAQLAGIANVTAIQLDVTNTVSIAQFASEAEKLGHLAGLLNNAGVVSAAPFEIEPPERFRKVIQVNFFGALCPQAAIHL